MFNQMTTYSKLYIDAIELPDQKTYFFNLIEVAKISGISIGAIIGGHVFYFSSNFETNAIIAATATLLSVRKYKLKRFHYLS